MKWYSNTMPVSLGQDINSVNQLDNKIHDLQLKGLGD